MSTFTIGETELISLLGHSSLGRDPLFARPLSLYATARGGRGCCGPRRGPAGMDMWRSAVAAALHRHLAVHPGVLAAAARQVFSLAGDAQARIVINGQTLVL